MLKKICQQLVIFLLCTTCDVVLAIENNDQLESYLQRIASQNIASGQFSQRKFFKVLKQPLVSHGQLHFDSSLGLLWHTQKPLSSRMLLKGQRLYSDDGISEIKEIKGAGIIAKVMFNAMVGNLSDVKSQFMIKVDENGRCFVLTPVESPLTTFITKMHLCSSSSFLSMPNEQIALTSIVLYEASGNRTEIDILLTAVNSLPEAIRAQLQ